MLGTPDRFASMKRAACVLALSAALVSCIALFDFDAFDPTRAPDTPDGPAVAVEPFAIRLSSTEVSGISGNTVALKVTIERRAQFADPITLGLAGGQDIALEAASVVGAAQETDAALLLGNKHGSLATTLTATSAAYPGFTATAPLTIVVRGQPGTLDTSFAGNGVTSVPPITSAALVNDGQWHHAAFVLDNIKGALYLDGVIPIRVQVERFINTGLQPGEDLRDYDEAASAACLPWI